MSAKSNTSSAKSAVGGKQSQQPFLVPRGIKTFPKPKLVMYRFLNVIKSKHNLLIEMLRFARSHLHSFIRRYWEDADLVQLIGQMREISLEEKNMNDQTPEVFSPPETTDAIQNSILMYVNWKCTSTRINLGERKSALQKLLHWIILEGIIDGKFKMSIDSKALATFHHIKGQSIAQLIVSSVLHKLYGDTRLLSKTDQGDLSTLFCYYDLTISARHKETYVQLANSLGLAPSDILLVAFSDTECRKAARAGYRVLKIKQQNQTRPKYANVIVINDISEIRFDN